MHFETPYGLTLHGLQIAVVKRTTTSNSCVEIMAATRYRRFLKLCEEWPKDESKKGRDLGTFLRQRVASAFREGENTQVLELINA